MTENTTATVETGQTIDKRLAAWAARSDLENNAIIKMLIVALQQGRYVAFWSTVNIIEVLPEPRFTGATRRIRRIQFLNTLRNVSVFLPVALTWAAISVATSAFGHFSSDNQATTVNFLSFWQDGYGYLADFWKIGAVARFDVIIVLIIIGLTLFIGRLQFAYDRDEITFLEEADDERVVLAMELQNFFHARREITPVTINEVVMQSIGTLRDMAIEMNGAKGQLRKSMDTLGDLVPRVNDVSTELVATSKATNITIADLVGSLSAGLNDATSVLKTMSSAVTGLGNDASAAASRVSDVERALSEAGNKLAGTISNFEQSADALKDRLDSGLASAIDKSSNLIEGIINEMSVTGTSLKTSARSVQDQLEELQRTISRQNNR